MRRRETDIAIEEEELKTNDISDEGETVKVEQSSANHNFSIGQIVRKLFPGCGWFIGTIEETKLSYIPSNLSTAKRRIIWKRKW